MDKKGNETQHAQAPTAASAGAVRGLGSQNPKQGMTMTGAQAVVASLEAEGVQVLFGYPGGQALSIYDALYDSKMLRHVLARHEQGAVHEADGYARATGDVGVVVVTSGPGATNTVTGIATAYMDSVPLVVLTGQVPRSVIGTDSFQESDIVGITMPVVKHSYLVKSADELARTIREAFYVAKTGRPGPVLIDLPSDVLEETTVFEYPDTVNIPSYKPTYKGNARQIKSAVAKIIASQRPVLYVGGGAVTSNAGEQIVRLARFARIPIVCTLMGKGAVPSSEPLNLGHVGMHGSKYANDALDRSDLIIACGARFSSRTTGNIERFAPKAEVIHIDIDPAEIGKVREAQVPIVGDLAYVLSVLCDQIEQAGEHGDTERWLEDIASWRERWPLFDEARSLSDEVIYADRALAKLSRMLEGTPSVVVTDVGQHQMWAAQHMRREEPRTFLSSGGLGTMGFGLPAAIGASIGCSDKTIVCVTGDGSLQMNCQEMATAAVESTPVKVVVINNEALGMVRQWQRVFCDGRYSQTDLPALPDFVKLADAFGWGAERVSDPAKLDESFERMLACDGPYLLDVATQREECVFPMVKPGGSACELIGYIDREQGGARVNVPEENGEKGGSHE